MREGFWRRLLEQGLLLPPLALAPESGRRFSPAAGGGRTRGPESQALHTFFEQSTDPMLVLDPGHTVLEANPAASRFLATPLERLTGASVLEVDPLARLLTAGSILQKLKTDAPPVVDEVSIVDSEGQPIQCRLEGIVLPGGRTLLHIRDTTAVLRARAALRAAEQLHAAVFEALPEIAWTMALPEERLLDISPSVERVFGYQPAAFREHPELWEELVHPADRERVRAELRKGLASGHPFEIHFTGMHRDHRDLPHLVNRVVPVKDERGWMDRCQGFIDDQGARRQIEATLRSTEANFRRVMESVSSGILLVEPGEDGVVVALCNRKLADMLRLDEPLKPGIPLAQAPEEVRALAYGSHSEAEFERLILSEDTQDEVAELEEPHRVLRRYAGPVRDSYGGVKGRIMIVEDVTASWLMQRRLAHAQKMESMGRLAGGVAHDFNNLLGTVLGFGSLLLEQTPEGDARRDALVQIVNAAERATRLTSALLAFSRSARFERLPVDLNRVIEESYQLLRSTLDPGVAIELRLDPAVPPLIGDALLLQQVVVNLVQDAQDRLGSGGSLRILTRLADTGKPADGEATDARAGDTRPHRMVSLELEVSAAARSEGGSAEPAASAHPRPPAKLGAHAGVVHPERAGLALTIAEDIARAHGGYLVAGPSAAPAVFRVMFPVVPPEEAPPLVPEVATAHGHETILVVDDEPGLRVLAKTGLQHRGFDVLTADDGERALEILRSGEPAVDLVLLDLSMPGLSGERVLRAIRGFKPDLPVVIASGYATVESQKAWNAAGAQGFVAKPYRIQDVAAKLRDVLDRAHGRVA